MYILFAPDGRYEWLADLSIVCLIDGRYEWLADLSIVCP